MLMRISPDQALKNFERISSSTDLDNPSEADTRSKIIDPILKECLNWQNEDVYREEYANPGFVDYILKIGKRNVLVIEAKKEGYSFKLPVTFGFIRNYTLGGVLSKEKPVIDAIIQARRYCSDKGTRFGAVTNGDQFIIFEAQKFGRDWEQCNCKVFYNFDDIQRNFIDFWNIISRDSVEKGNLIRELSISTEELKFIKPVDDVRFKNEIEPRNVLYRYMLPIIELTFKEITDQKDIEMLKECYVVEKKFEEVSVFLKNYLRKDSVEPSWKEIEEGEKHAGVFLTDFYDMMELLRKAPPDPVICLLLGRIGSGKTTFVHRFFNVVLDEDERKKVKWFYVDFRDAPLDKKSIRSHIIKSILREFELKYRDLFNSFLKKLKMNKAECTIEDLSKLFLMLKYENYVPSLIIDNVDQHIFGSPTYHESVFIEANNLTKELRTITIMTLREESFYRSSLGGVFDAYYIERYRITEPDFRELLLRRLNYILGRLELPKEELQKWLRSHGQSLNYEPQLNNIKEFLSIIKSTLQHLEIRSATRFISKTSGSNMRRALELFASFLVSGNTKVREMIETKRKEGNYIIAEHQFVKSIVLGNYRYYSKNSSYLMNIFDFNQEFSQSHFLKLKILNYAEDQIAVDSPYGGGYISINRIVEEAGQILVSREAIEDSLLELARYGLIMLNTRSRSDISKASHFKITDCGTFFLHVLIMRFSYIDLVLAHTPIADPDMALRIRGLLPSRLLSDRFERTQLFVDYLVEMEKREFENSPENKLSSFGKYRFMKKVSRIYAKNKEHIVESQKQKYLKLN